MSTPLSNDAIRELLSATLHGPLPAATMQRVFSTLAEVETLRTFLADTTEDMECLDGCDSYGHEEDCPVVNPFAAWRNLRTKLEKAEQERGMLTDAACKIRQMCSDAETGTLFIAPVLAALDATTEPETRNDRIDRIVKEQGNMLPMPVGRRSHQGRGPLRPGRAFR